MMRAKASATTTMLFEEPAVSATDLVDKRNVRLFKDKNNNVKVAINTRKGRKVMTLPNYEKYKAAGIAATKGWHAMDSFQPMAVGFEGVSLFKHPVLKSKKTVLEKKQAHANKYEGRRGIKTEGRLNFIRVESENIAALQKLFTKLARSS
jgi:hypothetical protein